MITVTTTPSRVKRLTDSLDFKDIRKVCEARGTLLENGADQDILRLYDEIRLAFIRKVGVRAYIAGRLERRAAFSADQCVIYDEGSLIVGSSGQTIVDFISQRYTPETLPDRIDVLRHNVKLKNTTKSQEIFWI